MTTSFSEIIEDSFQFVVLSDETDFEGGIQACQDNGFKIAHVNNRFQNDLLLSFLNDLRFTETDLLYLGLVDVNANPIEQSGSTSRFSFVSSNGEEIFFQDPFLYPWSEGQPNDEGGSENCVAVRGIDFSNVDNGFWEDVNCTNQLRVVCLNYLNDESNPESESNLDEDAILVASGMLVGLVLTIGCIICVRCCCCSSGGVDYAGKEEGTKHYLNENARRPNSDNVNYNSFRD